MWPTVAPERTACQSNFTLGSSRCSLAGEVGGSRKQFECVDVARPDDEKVRSIEGEDLPDVESCGDRDDTGVGGAESQVRVALDKLG